MLLSRVVSLNGLHSSRRASFADVAVLGCLWGMIFLCPAPARAIDISVTGSWNSVVINQANLSAGAGSDLFPYVESSSNQGLMSISNTGGLGDNWRVDVRRSDSVWDTAVAISVLRSGDGSGPGSLFGGTGYVTIGTTDSTFFSGAGDCADIPLQFKLNGLSIDVAPNTYSTTLTFTVVDT